MPEAEETLDLEAAIAQVMEQISDEDFAQIMEKFFENGHTLSTVLGISDEQLEAVYGLAYGEYNGGKYDRAHGLFKFLCQVDHMERKYWMGLGATRQMLRLYDESVEAYSMAGVLNHLDPEPPLRAAEVHLLIGDREAARSGFQYAVDCLADKPDDPMRRKAEARLAMLKAASGQNQTNSD